jgi:hypothetical protein
MKRIAPRVRRINLCGLEPEGPVLEALDQLGPGEQLCMLTEREPFSLYRILSNKAYAYCTSELPGALYEVAIWHCGAPPIRQLRG